MCMSQMPKLRWGVGDLAARVVYMYYVSPRW